ncbi:MAG TPA: M23 family metallopeptidase [Methylomirabilota bacterium]|jgi:murein DD-endopeptidase MepM/ murein hydrolase activator NlpD
MVPLSPASAPTRPRNSNKRVDHRQQFSLLIVRGDGVRILRLNFPRRLPTVLTAVVLVAMAGLTALVGDWWQVRQRMRDAASLFQQINDQQATIDTFNRRAASLRQEVEGWRDLHARIWEPFGPELTSRPAQSGVGGSRSTANQPMPPVPLSDMELLSEQVMEQGQSLRALDRLIGRARKALMGLPSRWPVRGAVNSEFGKRASPWTKEQEFHSGMDIAASRGTPVKAPAAGVVHYAGAGGEYGLAVIIDHDNGVRTLYGHLSKVLVQRGQRVDRSGVVGLSGNTGRSSGPHLHYEVYVKGQAVNPRAYLWDDGSAVMAASSHPPVRSVAAPAKPAPEPRVAPAVRSAPSMPREEVQAESVEEVGVLPEVDVTAPRN